ncbi:MAG TPA: ribosome biogenesis GTPase Der [Phycisphaerae bacterium]|nr:ribosome biogenesis GTPase Der [Phycisphaerae bacterium]HDZ44045.1 ribosome biogenesis GTPase Der [Phycisphaerae bacterium]
MSLPIVAIVGRPNVGKSSLFNALVRRRVAIVDATPGVTRDRIHAPWEVGEGEGAGYVELADTGGMGIEDTQDLTEEVETQIAYAVATAALMVFVTDAREGLTPLDRHVAEVLRRQDKPVILVANKVDTVTSAVELGDLYRLGFGEPLATSAKHALGLADLRDRVAEHLGDVIGDAPADDVMKLAVVGKRNAGKSTFINHLAGEERVIVSETPGTTRDSVDVTIERDGDQFIVIDTAGIRKRRSIAGDIEYYSQHRALRSVRRADVVALLIDAAVEISQVDKDLAGRIVAEDKPVVLVVNKWDLARDRTTGEAYVGYFTKLLPFLSYAPVSLVCATTGENVWQTIRLAQNLFNQSRTRVSTSEVNQAIQEILALRGPSHRPGTRPPKIRYASQVATCPPTIVCFVNDTRSFDQSYRRFLVNQLRDRLPFSEVPIRLIMRQGSVDRHDDGDSDR